MAVASNRDYKTRRESLYAEALGLTETRRDFGPIYNASGSYRNERNENGHDTLLGPRVEHFGTRGFTAGVNRLLATGATVGLNFSHNFIRYLDGDPRPAAGNSLGFNAVQPLLRGAGSLVTLEPLRQDERNLIYAVRDFRRYQQGFIIDVATRYYDLLARQDQLHNTVVNYQNAVIDWRKLQRLAQGGRATDIEVDQARQRVLEAEASLSRVQRDYSSQLDQFKLFLGLPIDLDLGPDRRELEALAGRGLLRPDMTLPQAIQVALNDRLDLANSRDAVDDAVRRVRIAEQNFLPTLDATFDYGTTRNLDKDRVRLDFRDNSIRWGFNSVLPLDWTPRRNNHRLALLGRDRAQRAYAEERDSLMLEVRDIWRNLDELRTSYRIQQESVRLAERRVRSTSMLLQMGRATARDLLEAQDSLLASRNAQTAALVSYTIARLRFWNAIERFEIDPKGMWNEDAEDAHDTPDDAQDTKVEVKEVSHP